MQRAAQAKKKERKDPPATRRFRTTSRISHGFFDPLWREGKDGRDKRSLKNYCPPPPLHASPIAARADASRGFRHGPRNGLLGKTKKLFSSFSSPLGTFLPRRSGAVQQSFSLESRDRRGGGGKKRRGAFKRRKEGKVETLMSGAHRKRRRKK